MRIPWFASVLMLVSATAAGATTSCPTYPSELPVAGAGCTLADGKTVLSNYTEVTTATGGAAIPNLANYATNFVAASGLSDIEEVPGGGGNFTAPVGGSLAFQYSYTLAAAQGDYVNGIEIGASFSEGGGTTIKSFQGFVYLCLGGPFSAMPAVGSVPTAASCSGAIFGPLTFGSAGSDAGLFPPSPTVGVYAYLGIAGGVVNASINEAFLFTPTPALVAQTYYFPHMAFGGGWQTTLTYVNYSPNSVSCQTTFYSDSGTAQEVPFSDGTVSARTDDFDPGADLHVQTQASSSGAVQEGWAKAQCTGPVKASLLYRLYNSAGTAQGEAGVNASTAPATEFVSFAQTLTGIAWANPSAAAASITITALDATGKSLGTKVVTLQPNAHGSANIGQLLGLSSFTGSVQVTSSEPIVTVLLNAEAYPVFSSLPPADLPAGTPLSGSTPSTATNNTTYYFPHLAFGGDWQTTLTYVNYSPETITCQTSFYTDSGAALQVPFSDGTVSTRTDTLAPGASIHVQTQAAAGGALVQGWAESGCSNPVKASLLYRLYNGTLAQGEAGVNATTTAAMEFASFAQTNTGIAWANPSTLPATILITALDASGTLLGTKTVTLQPGAHGSANIGPLLGLGDFTGSVEITSTFEIVTVLLNAEAYPVFSSLPPADLPLSTVLDISARE